MRDAKEEKKNLIWSGTARNIYVKCYVVNMVCGAECTKHSLGRHSYTAVYMCCTQVGILRKYIHLAHTALPHPCQTPQGVNWYKETNECLTIKMRKQMNT